jgi:dihydroflavonol-4-reductase
VSPTERGVVFVTGLTGFIGSALAPALARRGWAVHALARAGSDRGAVGSADVAWHAGELGDSGALERALQAARRAAGTAPLDAIHNAALISYRTRDARLHREVNVEGTRRILDALAAAGVRRAVHVSSIVAVGHARSAAESLDEDAPFNSAPLGCDYVDTKRAAEELALAACDRIDLSVVNPGAVFGPSPRPSNSTRFLARIAAGRGPPLAPPGSSAVVGVRDVAEGICLALERGRRGRRYVLVERNLTYLELLRQVAGAFGVRGPLRATPRWLWSLVVLGGRAVDRAVPLELVPPQGLKLLGVHYRFDAARARRELGWAPQPFDDVLSETVESLRRRGLAAD